MKKILFLIGILLLSACSSDIEETPIHKESASESEITPIETLFNEDKFENPKHIELLKELKICSEFQKDTSNYIEPACSPNFFKIFDLRDDVPVENAFLLQIKSKVGGIKLRRLIVFERERGELVKVNTFIANLIGLRKSKTHYPDLILRFNDNVEGDIIFYNTIFAWDGSKYKFKTVETIEGTDADGPWRQRLKQEFKDSVSKDIYNTLVKNEMIL
jgi:hypothetical protein